MNKYCICEIYIFTCRRIRFVFDCAKSCVPSNRTYSSMRRSRGCRIRRFDNGTPIYIPRRACPSDI